VNREVMISAGAVDLPGIHTTTRDALATVVFAHGSGSSRFSRRNLEVAGALNESDFDTLLFDLLTEPESQDRANVFDIPLLAARMVDATRWVAERYPGPICYFGASTGAAAALVAATTPGQEISAVVSRGGRPDLAGKALQTVRSPTLLIVGGADIEVLGLNQAALDNMKCERRLDIVPGATHLFEEPGALEVVAGLATDWFATHCPAGVTPADGLGPRPH
jgi:pimeloyl-ACP methyl ester carboxylesterase